MPIIIRLQNLPMSANAANIRRFFSGLTIPEGGVHIVGGNDGDAFIAFSQEDDARKAMLLDNQAINGSPIRLFLSSKSEMKSVIEAARNLAVYGLPSQSQQSNLPQPKQEDNLRAKSTQPITSQQSAMPPLTSHLNFPNNSDVLQMQQPPPVPTGFSTYQYGYCAPPDRNDIQPNKIPPVSAASSRQDYPVQPDPYASVAPYVREVREAMSFTQPLTDAVDPRQQPRLTVPDQRSAPAVYGYQPPPANYPYPNLPAVQPQLPDYPALNKPPPTHLTPPNDPYWSQRDRPPQIPYQQPPPAGPLPFNYMDPYSQKHPIPQLQPLPVQHYDFDRRPPPSHGKLDDPFSTQPQVSNNSPAQPVVIPPPHDNYLNYNARIPPPNVDDSRRQQNIEEVPPFGGRSNRPLNDKPPYVNSPRGRMGTLPSGDQVYPGSTNEEQNYQQHRGQAPDKYERERDSSRGFSGSQPPIRTPSNSERDFSIRPPWLDTEENRAAAAAQRGKRSGDPPLPGGAFFHDSQNDNQDDGINKRRRGPPFSDERANDFPQQISGSKSGLIETEFIARLSFDPVDTAVRHVFDILRGVQIVPKYGIRIEEDSQHRSTGYVYVMLPSREMMDRTLSCDKYRIKGRPVSVVESSLSDFYRVSDPSFTSKAPPEFARKAVAASSRQPPPHHDDGCIEVSCLPFDADAEEVKVFLGAPGLTTSSIKVVPVSGQGNRTSKAYVRLPSVGDLGILMSAKPRPFRMSSASLGVVTLTPISRLQYDSFNGPSDNFNRDRDSSRRSSQNESSLKLSNESSKTNQVLDKPSPKVCLCVQGFSRPVKVVDVLTLIKTVLIPGNGVHLIPPAFTGALIDLISENNCIKAKIELDGDIDSDGPITQAKQAHPDLKVETLTREQFEQRVSVVSSGVSNPTQEEIVPDHDSVNTVENPDQSKEDHHEQHSPDSFPGRGHPEEYPGDRGDRGDRGNRFGNRGGRFGGPTPYFDNQFRNNGPHFDPGRRGGRPPLNFRGPPGHSNGPVGHGSQVLYLGNMPSGTTPEQVFDILSGYRFDRNSVRMKRTPNGQLTGDAMVAFESPQEAERVLCELAGRARFQNRMVMFQFEPF